MKLTSKKIKLQMRKICIVDRALIFIMIIILVYTALNLCLPHSITDDVNNIDVVIRSSAAAILGYFLSGNFLKNTSVESSGALSGVITPSGIGKPNEINNRIGFQGNTDSLKNQSAVISSDTDKPTEESVYYRKIQIIVVTAIGLLSLLILLILRNFADIQSGSAETISQLRDFVSSCVGFLISCGKHPNN